MLDGVADACNRLRAKGFLLIVVTNQPDLARGTQSHEAVSQLNELLQSQIAFDAIRVCPHDDADQCPCRKPKPGLLVEAAADFGISLTDSYMVGDRWRDIEAGQRAGCRTVWIRYPYSERSPETFDLTANSLREAEEWLI